MHYKNRDKNIYVLGASAYASYDYKLLDSYDGRVLEFGYFPEGEKLSWEYFSYVKNNKIKWEDIFYSNLKKKLMS